MNKLKIAMLPTSAAQSSAASWSLQSQSKTDMQQSKESEMQAAQQEIQQEESKFNV